MNAFQHRCLVEGPKLDLLGKDINRCNGGDPVLIPRFNYASGKDDDDPALGPCWSPLRAFRTEEKLKPLVRCVCGAWTGIGLHHVWADGRVTASFYHATPEQLGPEGVKRFGSDGCGWHVFIKLADYDQGDFPGEPDKSAPAARVDAVRHPIRTIPVPVGPLIAGRPNAFRRADG